jgi:hypothetical protein
MSDTMLTPPPNAQIMPAFPLTIYCERKFLDEVRALTVDWDQHRDLSPVFRLLREAKALGFALVKL